MSEIVPAITFTGFLLLPFDIREKIWDLAIFNRTRAREAHFFRVHETAIPSSDATSQKPDKNEAGRGIRQEGFISSIGPPTWNRRPASGSWYADDNPSSYAMSAGLWFACAESRRVVQRCLDQYDTSQFPDFKSLSKEVPLCRTQPDAFQNGDSRWTNCAFRGFDRCWRCGRQDHRPIGFDKYLNQTWRPYRRQRTLHLHHEEQKGIVNVRGNYDLFVFQITSRNTFFHLPRLRFGGIAEALQFAHTSSGWPKVTYIGLEYRPEWPSELAQQTWYTGTCPYEQQGTLQLEEEAKYLYHQNQFHQWLGGSDSLDQTTSRSSTNERGELVLRGLMRELINVGAMGDGQGFWLLDHSLRPVRGASEAAILDKRFVFEAKGRRYVSVSPDDIGKTWELPGETTGVVVGSSTRRTIQTSLDLLLLLDYEIRTYLDRYLHYEMHRGLREGVELLMPRPAGRRMNMGLGVLACLYHDELKVRPGTEGGGTMGFEPLTLS